MSARPPPRRQHRDSDRVLGPSTNRMEGAEGVFDRAGAYRRKQGSSMGQQGSNIGQKRTHA
eukprot:90215-Rhodomonas_salina.1